MLRVGGEALGSPPLLPLPISVHNRVRETGELTNEWLCQLNNEENRAFRDLFEREFGKGTFPATGFSVKQLEDLSWVHSTSHADPFKKKLLCLTTHYDFVFESEGSGAPEAGGGSAAGGK